MSLALITLPTNKSISTVSDHVRKVGQGEKGQKLDVIVTDANGSGYDLTDRIITFSENKESGKIVSDNEAAHFNITDAKAGRFTYTLADAIYAASGIAWFDISSKDGDVIDTTKSFNIDVIQDETIHVNNDNYVSSLTALETHYKAVIQKTEDDRDALFKKWQKDFDDLIKNGNTNIQDVVNNANKLINDWKKELTSEQQSLAKLQSDWKTQTAQINSDYDAQKKAIQLAADNQLSANKTASDKAIAQIETDKQAALKQANADFRDKLASIQADYDSWKASATTDFQKQLDKLAAELKNDEDAQAKLQQAIDSANKAIANINNVDFTKFAHKEDLEKIYTVSNPILVDKETDPDTLCDPGIYYSENGFNFGNKAPADYRSSKSYILVLLGDRPDNSTFYYQQFLFQATKFEYKCWYRGGYKYGTNSYYFVSFTDLKDIYGKLKQISINGGTPISPNDKGVADLDIPQPDLSAYETKADAKTAHDSINNSLDQMPKTVNNVKPDDKGNIPISIPDVEPIKKDITTVQGQMTEIKQSMMKSWAGTLTQYQALTSYDPMTMYFIISDYEVVVK